MLPFAGAWKDLGASVKLNIKLQNWGYKSSLLLLLLLHVLCNKGEERFLPPHQSILGNKIIQMMMVTRSEEEEWAQIDKGNRDSAVQKERDLNFTTLFLLVLSCTLQHLLLGIHHLISLPLAHHPPFIDHKFLVLFFIEKQLGLSQFYDFTSNDFYSLLIYHQRKRRRKRRRAGQDIKVMFRKETKHILFMFWFQSKFFLFLLKNHIHYGQTFILLRPPKQFN